MKIFGTICFGVFAIITTSLVGGFTFMKLWEWFIAQTFSVQTLTFIQAIGIAFFMNFLKGLKKEKGKLTLEKVIEDFSNRMIFLGTALSIGWVITLFQ